MNEQKKNKCESPMYIVSAACCLGTQKNKEEMCAVIRPIQPQKIYGFIFKMAKYWSRCVIKGLAEQWKGLSRNDPLYFAWGRIKAQQLISSVVK